jgi:mannitol/fructose-specific phosphotransferase system IIA component
MFGKKKKNEDHLELLSMKNIKVNCKADQKENIIRQVGQMLVDSNYVNQGYVEAMIKREESVSTYMGSGLAIPHGIEAVKKDIKASGIAVMIFPDGTNWDGETVYVVIGIAGVGDEHLDILALVAEKMLEDDAIETFTSASEDDIYRMLNVN